MKGEPAERLDPRAITLWRITGALNMLPLLVGAGFAGWALSRSGVSRLFEVLPMLAVLVLAGVVVGVVPGLRWRRWRYEIRPDEVDLQRGIFWISRTLVPLARIQHVDTRQGPLQRRFGLSTPAAERARDRIAELTREQDEL